MFGFLKKEKTEQSDYDLWFSRWQSIVPPECRNVKITVDGETVVAFVQSNHFVMMMQDGLLMDEGFFRVTEFFQRAGYYVIWLMRCTKDIENGFLKAPKAGTNGIMTWDWKSPTTNFGKWSTDNSKVSIVLQYKAESDTPPAQSNEQILARVQWAQSGEDNAKMIPGFTQFTTTDVPCTPYQLSLWLQGKRLSEVRGAKYEQ